MPHRLSGNGANAEEKQVALQMADKFIDQMSYPRMKTQVPLSLFYSVVSGLMLALNVFIAALSVCHLLWLLQPLDMILHNHLQI